MANTIIYKDFSCSVNEVKIKTSTRRYLNINFEKLYGINYENLNIDLDLSKKRIYNNIIDDIVDTVQYLGQRVEFIPNIMAGIITRMESGNYDEEIFLENLKDLVIIAKDEIINHTSNNYKDSDFSENNSKINKELQFKNEHITPVISMAMAMRLAIPFITHYMHLNSISNKEFHIIKRLFNYIIILYTPKDSDGNMTMDIDVKLYKIVHSRIITTSYSDKVMWRILNDQGNDETIFIKQIHGKLKYDIMPKLRNSNVINFLHVYIKNNLNYLFSSKFPISIKTVNTSVTDSDGMTSLDKMEVQFKRINEGDYILNLTNIRELCSYIEDEVDMKEVEFYMEEHPYNNIQQNILFMFFSKTFNSYTNLYSLDKQQYYLLIVYLKNWLKENNFTLLYEYLTAGHIKDIVEKDKINKQLFLNKLFNSKEFKNITKNFVLFSTSLINSGVLIKNIITLNQNKFYSINYGQEINSDILIDSKLDDLGVEYLRFITVIAN